MKLTTNNHSSPQHHSLVLLAPDLTGSIECGSCVQAGGESVTQEARAAQGGGEEEAEGHSHAHGQAAEHARPAAKVIPIHL